MTTIAVPRRSSDNLAQRWSRADTRSDVSPHHQSEPTTATFNDNLEQQTQLLLSPVRHQPAQRALRTRASTFHLG